MTPQRIHRLSRALINRIAAGEVVERPASVVKELAENAVDAQASHLEIVLEQGGKRLIRVSDNGLGIAPDDLPLALESHATSKIAATDDLFEVSTLGFRGEALASIGSVSHCRIVSRARGARAGAAIECNGGVLGQAKSCGAPEGTIVEVRDLFFNTPARLKFMRTVPTELRHAIEAVTRLALSHPALDLHLIHAKRSVLRLAPAKTQRQRLRAVFGDQVCAGLLPVQSESAAMAVTGFVSAPGEGMTSSLQYVSLNGRYIRDRAIYRAVAEAYRNRMVKGRFPAVFLSLQIDPARVDVNVHPTKIEVRFRDAGAVFAQILTALEKTLGAAGPVRGGAPSPQAAERRERVQTALVEFFERGAKEAGPAVRAGSAPGRAAAPPPPPVGERPVQRLTSEVESEPSPPEPRPGPRAFFQLHRAYIVEEVEDGFLLIDQHALHERILYAELARRVAKAAVPRQRLLVPELIEMRPQEFLRVMEMKDELLKLGVEIEAFGERTVAVHAVPHLAGNINAREFVLDLLNSPGPVADRATDRRDHLMTMIACKAAIKAGERLSHMQIEALLEQRDRIGPESTCPHGRPTTIRFERSDLEKMFQRR